MFEVIKNLKPSHRLQAFLFAALLSTASAVLTVYLKTDDCSGLAAQYQVLVKNYTETMAINNTLIESNNKKDRDMIAIKNLLDEMDNIKPETTTKTTVRSNERVYAVVKDEGSNGMGGGSNSGVVSDAMVRPIPKEKIIETKTTITKVPDKQKQLIDSIQNILKDYKDK
jgi:hypothetical protein